MHEVPDLEVQERIVAGLTAGQTTWFVLALLAALLLALPQPARTILVSGQPGAGALRERPESGGESAPLPPVEREAQPGVAQTPFAWSVPRLVAAALVLTGAAVCALVRPDGIAFLTWTSLALLYLARPKRAVWAPDPADEVWRPLFPETGETESEEDESW